jgi:hypothetical protein
MTAAGMKPSRRQLREQREQQRRAELPPGNVAEFKSNR